MVKQAKGIQEAQLRQCPKMGADIPTLERDSENLLDELIAYETERG